MSNTLKKDLIIITTKSAFLPGSKNPKILFKEEACQSYDHSQSLLKAFDNYRDTPHQVFRLKEDGSLIFATSCLRKETIEQGEVIPEEKRLEFIPALFQEVSGYLSEDEKGQVGRIFIIAHGFDIKLDDRGFKKVENASLLNSMKTVSWLDKSVELGNFSKTYEANTLPVFFIAFSHVPNRHAFYDVLARPEEIFRDNTLGKGALITQLIKYECGQIPEDEWEGIPISNPKPEALEGLTFKFHFIKGKKIENIASGATAEWINKAKSIFPENSKIGAVVNVVFVSLAQLIAHNDTFFESINDLVKNKFKLRETNPDKYPTLFFGYKDIMSNENLATQEGLRLDRRFRFMDSSIWFRYAALENPETLNSALQTFQWAYYYNLYKKNVCQEYVEFYSRLFENSKLEDFGDGHALNVFPFVFHSEFKMEQDRNDLYKHKIALKKLKWNFLLIDDYADIELRQGQEDVVSQSDKSKGEIIKNLIDDAPGLPKISTSEHSMIEKNGYWRANSVEEAISDYFSNTGKGRMLPDIILLDYLFSYPRETQHYGTEFLKAIQDKIVTGSRSVSQKYWIHPISVFNEAMFSELQEKSYQHFEPQWNLARGADPINTPLLFRRSLLEFMDVQAELLLFDQEELWTFLVDQGIQNTEKNYDQNVLLNAFRNFLEQFSADEGIDTLSAIGESARNHLQAADREALALRDHLRQILFLFAYTTGFDFPAIQREFAQIDRIYAEYYRKNQGKESLSKLKETMSTLAEWVYNTSSKHL